MKTLRSIGWLALAGMIAVSVMSCNVWEHEKRSPTSPMDGSAEQYGQFFATGSATAVFEWNYEDGAGVFCVSFPEAGDFLLTYWTNSGAFNIVLRALKPTYTYIGLMPGDQVMDVKIERGTVVENATPLSEDGDVLRYATPSVPTVWWGSVFAVDSEVPLRRGSGECHLIIATKKTLNLPAFTVAPKASGAKRAALAKNPDNAGRKVIKAERQKRLEARRQEVKAKIQQKLKELKERKFGH